MFRTAALLFALAPVALVALPSGAAAQQAEVLRPGQSESGQDYDRALRFRAVDRVVDYFVPAGPEPDLQTTAPEPPPTAPRQSQVSPEEVAETAGTTWVVIVALSAVGLVALIAWASRGGRSGNTLSATPEAGRRRSTGTNTASQPGVPVAPGLTQILAQPDRRVALVALVWAVLDRRLDKMGVLRQASWTARDALRHLQRGGGVPEALRALVTEAEAVQFGDRPLSEEGFQRHLAVARTLMPQGTGR